MVTVLNRIRDKEEWWIPIADRQPNILDWIFVASQDGQKTQYCRYLGTTAEGKNAYLIFLKDENGAFVITVDLDVVWWTKAPLPPKILNF